MIERVSATCVLLFALALCAAGSNAAEVRHVYPPGFEGEKTGEKSFSTLEGALRGSDSSWRTPDQIKPGSTIVIHAGTLKADRYSYRDKHGLHYFGTYFPAAVSRHLRWSGGDLPEALTIRAAGDGEVVLDGADNNILMDLTGCGPVVVEGFTFTNTEVAILAGERGGIPCPKLTLRDCAFRDVQVGLWANNRSCENYVIENCTFTGRRGRTTNGLTLAGRGHTLEGNTFEGVDDETVIYEEYRPLPELVGRAAHDEGFPPQDPDDTREQTIAREMHQDPPTLHCLGFAWRIEGDANRNAEVEVRYRRQGKDEWRQALPLFRPDFSAQEHGPRDEPVKAYFRTKARVFSGSIVNLQPGTTYECRFTMTDREGVEGESTRTVTASTRAEPALPAGGRNIHVYPENYLGDKATPNAPTLEAAFIGPDAARAGDVVLMHAGTYRPDRQGYRNEGGYLSVGGYQIRAEGTPENYMAIGPAGDGEVVIDAGGAEHVLDVRFSRYLCVEGLTLRNAEIGVKCTSTSTECRALVAPRGFMLKDCRVEDTFIGLWGLGPRAAGFVVLDNTFVAREWKGEYDSKWDHLYSEAGIDLNGKGHVVGHNRIANFWDGINFYGKAVAVDFFGNQVEGQKDNSFGNGASGESRNVRVWGNSFGGGGPCLHLHPSGGPLLMFRNRVGGGGFFKLQFGRTNGVRYYHNYHDLGWSRVGGIKRTTGKLDLRNNVWKGDVCRLATLSSETRVDYNAWQKPKKEAAWQYKTPEGQGEFDTAEALSEAIGWCEHAVVVEDLRAVLRGTAPADSSPLVDSGVRLPNINDKHKGKAPDIDMLEYGEDMLHYGPRREK